MEGLIFVILRYANYDKDPKPIILCVCFVMSRSCRFVLIT